MLCDIVVEVDVRVLEIDHCRRRVYTWVSGTCGSHVGCGREGRDVVRLG